MTALAPRSAEDTAKLYHKHVDMVYRICLLFLKNAAEAEDATQTVFVRLIMANPVFNDEEHEKRWLILAAKNICKDVLKSAWHVKRSDYHTANKQAYSQLNDPDMEDIWLKITKLGEKYKLPLYLYYYEGYKTEEISVMLKLNHATVRTRLRSAKKKLKLLIEGDKNDKLK